MLRPFQTKLNEDISSSLDCLRSELDNPVVLGVLPTGGGKTVCMSHMIESFDGPQAAIAHRSELVSQISTALARQQIPHSVVGSEATVRNCRMAHLDEVGRSFVQPEADIRVCSIDTLLRHPASDPWLSRVRRWHGDEGHHFLAANKWGKGVAMLPKSEGVLWTATPIRADGKGLGRHADGVADHMVLGPGMRDMINMGYLTDYDLITPEVPDLDMEGVGTGSTGDFVFEQVRAAVKKSKRLAGDVVERYLEFALGKRCIVFAVDIEEAIKYATAFKSRGIRAEVVTGKTPDALRRDILRRFALGAIDVLVNVDLFGEGFDVPACEVVIMARPTWSYALYAQQFGRALRLLIDAPLSRQWGSFTDAQRLAYIAASAKPVATVIDLVGNWMRNHLPDWIGHMPGWTLDRRAARSQVPNDAIPLTRCEACARPYERHLSACPHCDHRPVPAERKRIEQVDGAVYRLSPEALDALRNQVDANMRPPVLPSSAPFAAKAGAQARHQEKMAEIRNLQEAMGAWCAWTNQRYGGRLSDDEQMKAFYLVFGIDTLSAQGLKRAEAAALRAKIMQALSIDNVVIKAA